MKKQMDSNDVTILVVLSVGILIGFCIGKITSTPHTQPSTTRQRLAEFSSLENYKNMEWHYLFVTKGERTLCLKIEECWYDGVIDHLFDNGFKIRTATEDNYVRGKDEKGCLVECRVVDEKVTEFDLSKI